MWFAPGWIDTVRDWSQYPTLRNEKEVRRIPVRRIGTVTDIAAACLYLGVTSAGFINVKSFMQTRGDTCLNRGDAMKRYWLM